MVLALAACATEQRLEDTSKALESKTESVRSELTDKIEQLNKTQRYAEEQQAELKRLLDETKRELKDTRQLAAELKSNLREVKDQDLSGLRGRLEEDRRDIRDLYGRVEDQSAQVSALIDTAVQKLTGKVDAQALRLQAQGKAFEEFEEQVALVEGHVATLDKRESAASAQAQEVLTTIGKKTDERLETQDRRLDNLVKRDETIEALVKKVEGDGRATAGHVAAVEKNLAQVTDTLKTVGAKLSNQIDHQAVLLAKLEEAKKQADFQVQALSAQVHQFQGTLSEFSKALHVLTDKSTEADRRVTELAGRIEGKAGLLVVQQSEQAAKIEKLAKQIDAEGQAVATHLNKVTQTVSALTKSLELVQAKAGHWDAAMVTVNETVRALGELKRVMEDTFMRLEARVESQGDALKQALHQVSAGTSASNEPSPSAAASELPRQAVLEPRPVPESPRLTPGGAPAAGTPKDAYDLAYQEYTQGRYDSALASFRNFLAQFPDSSLAPNAHFWSAECYVKGRDFTRGIESYEKVIMRYPNSGKASIALYRKALALLELNDKAAAKAALRQVIANYPKSDEFDRARAKLASLP